MPSNRQADTLLQFSLRSALAAMTLLGIVFATIAPLVRAQPLETRRPLVQMIVISGLVAAVGMVVLWFVWQEDIANPDPAVQSVLRRAAGEIGRSR